MGIVQYILWVCQSVSLCIQKFPIHSVTPAVLDIFFSYLTQMNTSTGWCVMCYVLLYCSMPSDYLVMPLLKRKHTKPCKFCHVHSVVMDWTVWYGNVKTIVLIMSEGANSCSYLMYPMIRSESSIRKIFLICAILNVFFFYLWDILNLFYDAARFWLRNQYFYFKISSTWPA